MDFQIKLLPSATKIKIIILGLTKIVVLLANLI